jgi:ABC-type transport system substrate-binding protein
VQDGEQIPLPRYRDGKSAERKDCHYIVSPREISTAFNNLVGSGAYYIKNFVDSEGVAHISLWQRGADGQLTKTPGQRFQLTLRGDERIVSILLDQWKGIGVSGQIETLPTQIQRDRAARASFTGADVNTGPTSLFNVVTRFGSDYIPGPENQWTGLNRGGYTSPQWDRLTEAFFVTLEEARRVEIERELVRAFTTDLPALPLYYGLEAVPTGGGLTGLLPIRGSPHAGVILHTWNVHEWDIRG